MLADEIDDAPASVALLDVCESERCDLGPSKTAAEQDGENGAVAQASYGRRCRRVSRLCACHC